MHVFFDSDDCDRNVSNVLVGKLDPNGYHPPYLVNCEFIEQAPNNEIITTLVEETIDSLGIRDRGHFKALLSDGVSYMVKAGKNLKEMYKCLIHITCLVHALHRVCEEVKAMCSKLNKLITTVKQIYRKAGSRVLAWKKAYPHVPVPPLPCLTRWGTWIEAALYYHQYFDAVHDMVNRLKDVDAAAIPKAKKLLDSQDLANQLQWVARNLGFLPEIIKRMEEEGLTVQESIGLLDEAGEKVAALKGNTDLEAKMVERLKAKFDSVVEKNPDIGVIRGMLHPAMSGEKLSNELSLLKYCPVTNVDCERSFSYELSHFVTFPEYSDLRKNCRTIHK